MTRVALSERFIASPKRVPAQGRADFPDALVPGLSLRVTASGHRSFVLIARYPSNPKNPTRRALGDYGAITLEEARHHAREWLALLQRGIDPKIEAERRKAEAQRQQVTTFAHVAGEYLTRHGATLAHADAARRIIETEFVKRWGNRPVTDIRPEEAAAAIRAIVARGAPYQAHNALGHLRRLFSWARGTNEFGVVDSPVDRLRPADLIGRRESRDRILTDDELRAVWQATSGPTDATALAEARRRDQPREAGAPLGYPYGPLFRMMILTGQREREVAGMRWREIDLDAALWTIPAPRMKGKRAHVVPLAPDALALLRSLPRFSRGDAVFSATDGASPLNGFSKPKARLDAASGVKDWILHDLRRTMRTHLSALPVPDLVRELTIAHAKPGLHRVYDMHGYVDEKRECLELWERRLRGILAPKPPAEIVTLVGRRAAS
jgi:integrase